MLKYEPTHVVFVLWYHLYFQVKLKEKILSWTVPSSKKFGIEFLPNYTKKIDDRYSLTHCPNQCAEQSQYQQCIQAVEQKYYCQTPTRQIANAKYVFKLTRWQNRIPSCLQKFPVEELFVAIPEITGTCLTALNH